MHTRYRDSVIPGMFAFAFITLYGVKSDCAPSVMLTFGASMALAYLLYMLSSYRRMPETERVLPMYLVALALTPLHILEEFFAEFYIRFPVEIYNGDPFGAADFVLSQMVLMFLLVIGALGIYKQWKMPMVMVWFTVIMLLIVNAIQHPIYCVMVGGYFPGIFTSLPGLILGPMLFMRLWEVRKRSDENRCSCPVS